MGTVKFGLGIVDNQYGHGRHIYYVSLANAQVALKLLYVDEIVSLFAICFVKVSVALFLLRIGNLRRWLRMALIANTLFLVGSTIAFAIILLIQCRPVNANWNLLAKAKAKCLSADTLVDISYLTTGLHTLLFSKRHSLTCHSHLDSYRLCLCGTSISNPVGSQNQPENKKFYSLADELGFSVSR